MILIVDNYNSFAYNLVQYVGELADVAVRRNDTIDIAGIRDHDPDSIIVSPGPEPPPTPASRSTFSQRRRIPRSACV